MAPTRTSKRESKRTSPKPFKAERVICPDCGTSINRKTDLPRHRKTHEPRAFRYYCEEPGCDFSCLQKSALKPHGNTHSKAKTEHCPDCTQSFADASSLNRHRKNEHGHVSHHTKAYLEIKAIKGGKKSASKKGASKATPSAAVRAEKRDERRATPYGVPAPTARSAARAKKTAKESSSAFADAELFYAPSNDSFSSSAFSDLSELLRSLPHLSLSSDAPSLTYSSSLSTTASNPASSSSWNENDFDVSMLDSPMPQGSPFPVSGPMCGYEVGLTDGNWASFVQQESNNCYGMNSSAPIPAQNWTGADVYSQALYNAVQATPAPEANFHAAMFQDAPVSYSGAVSQSMKYALPLAQASMPTLGFNATYDQYAPVQVEQLQPAASQALSDLAAQMNVSEQQVALWLAEMDQATPEFYTQ